MSKAYTKIGVVVKPHGLKGEVAMKPEGGVVERLRSFASVFLLLGGAHVPFVLEGVATLSNSNAKLKLRGIATGTEAETLRGVEVYQTTALMGVEKQLDLRGFEVVLVTGSLVGVVADVVENPAQTLLVVETTTGDEAFIPLVDGFVVAIDTHKKCLTMDLPEGLLELNSHIGQ